MSRSLLLLVLTLSSLHGEGAPTAVMVRFNPSDPQIGPFPADALTVPDSGEMTGLRVNLPVDNCGAVPALCGVLGLVNQLDGFNIRPRIAVTFSDVVDTSTLRAGMFFIAVDTGDTTAVNQITYDPATNTAYAKPDSILDQHRRYALVVTDAIHDLAGNPVSADTAFTACRQSSDTSGYCADLAQALSSIPLPASNIVAASVFTTQAATAWMESAREQLQCMPIVTHHPDGPYVFNVPDLASLTVNFDTGSGNFSSFTLPIGSPGYSSLFGGVGRIAFGSYLSPMVLNETQTIDPLPSLTGAIVPTPMNEVSFHVYLPNTPAPPNGYPVVIFGHGLTDSSVGGPTVIAPELALAGFATIAINAFGHGYGPQSTVVLTSNNGDSATLSLGGRGIDRNGDGKITGAEGCLILSPLPIGLRDCIRQTSVDLMQLVRVIQAGLDLDGDGTPDLDGARIYYAGQSLGSLYGTVFTAVEKGVRATMLNVGGGSVVDISRWSPGFAAADASFLPAGAVDNFPFRDQPVSVDPPGASDAGYYLELIEWLDNSGDPIAFAPYLRSRPALFQIARADHTMPNPASTDLILAARKAESTWMYRHDLALAAFPDQLPQDPHSYLALFLGNGGGTVTLPSLAALQIGLAAQVQVAQFFSADGAAIPDMNQILPGPLFEIPVTLPNDLGP